MNFIQTLKHKLSIAINSLNPQQCALCTCMLPSYSKTRICIECENSLPILGCCCSLCCEPLASDNELCSTCLKTKRHWDQCHAVYEYKSPVDSLIHKFKYENRNDLSKTLASFICLEIKEHYDVLPDILIPIPMHLKRLSQRGYNHSLRLSQAISKQLNIPWKVLLLKNKYTPTQVGMTSKERKAQMKQSFSIHQDANKELYEGRFIALIDDVVTTGASSSEAAKTLKKAGAKQVHIWCIARA